MSQDIHENETVRRREVIGNNDTKRKTERERGMTQAIGLPLGVRGPFTARRNKTNKNLTVERKSDVDELAFCFCLLGCRESSVSFLLDKRNYSAGLNGRGRVWRRNERCRSFSVVLMRVELRLVAAIGFARSMKYEREERIDQSQYHFKFKQMYAVARREKRRDQKPFTSKKKKKKNNGRGETR